MGGIRDVASDGNSTNSCSVGPGSIEGHLLIHQLRLPGTKGWAAEGILKKCQWFIPIWGKARTIQRTGIFPHWPAAGRNCHAYM